MSWLSGNKVLLLSAFANISAIYWISRMGLDAWAMCRTGEAIVDACLVAMNVSVLVFQFETFLTNRLVDKRQAKAHAEAMTMLFPEDGPQEQK